MKALDAAKRLRVAFSASVKHIWQTWKHDLPLMRLLRNPVKLEAAILVHLKARCPRCNILFGHIYPNV
jgi:hypothetical protein